MKTLVIGLAAALASFGVALEDALAFSCPTLVKAANESIGQAEGKVASVAGDREKARAQGMVEEAKELVREAEAAHASGAHARSEAKAKAAQWLAEQVK